MLLKRICIGLILLTIAWGGAPLRVWKTAPTIQNAQILTPSVALYERFEMRFDVTTAATHLTLPYDAAPPPGLEGVRGVSAEAVFTSPGGKTWTQPAFLFQPYQETGAGVEDHWLPNGAAHWRVRFTPQEAGQWQARLHVRDAGGAAEYPRNAALRFEVKGTSANPATRRGFLQVAKADPRYFEFGDGSAFHAAGFNDGFASAAGVGPDRQTKRPGLPVDQEPRFHLANRHPGTPNCRNRWNDHPTRAATG